MKTEGLRFVYALAKVMALVLIALPSLASEKEAPPGKAAVVNGSVITQEDLDREMNVIQQQLSNERKPPDDSQLLEMKKKVLENLIDVELLYQEAQREGMVVSDAAINEQIESVKSRFPNEDQFKGALSQMNLSEADLKSQIKRGLTVNKFIDKKFVQTTTVSEGETKTYYDSHPDSFRRPEQVKASHILIKVGAQATPSEKAEALTKMKDIQHKLQKGGDFADLAKESSECPSAAKGGDLGYFSRGQMVRPFEETAFALKTGETSDIVETRFGYHLIKVVDKRPEGKIAYEEVKEKLQQHVKQEKVRGEVETYVNQLKESAEVKRFL